MNYQVDKRLPWKIALFAFTLFTISCWNNKNSLITRAWRLKKIEGYDRTVDSSSVSTDQYHTFLKNVIIEHKRHNSSHYGITWVFKPDSTFKIIFKDNNNETCDNKWHIKDDTIFLAIWHNDFYLKFVINKLTKDSLVLENNESGKTPTKLVFASYKKNQNFNLYQKMKPAEKNQ